MTPSAFTRFIRANPNKYDGLTSQAAQQQEMYARLTSGIGQDYDYGMQGKLDERGHSGDAGKLPWHPTFSTQSAFATKETPGGVWGKGTFTPSNRMSKDKERMWNLKRYMRDVEPNTKLIIKD